MTLCRDRNDPTDCASSRKVARSTLATSTPAARGAELAAAGDTATEDAPESAPIARGPVALFWYHHAAPDAAAMPITATTE